MLQPAPYFLRRVITQPPAARRVTCARGKVLAQSSQSACRAPSQSPACFGSSHDDSSDHWGDVNDDLTHQRIAHDLGRTRAYNPRLSRPMPYPLGHKANGASRKSGITQPPNRIDANIKSSRVPACSLESACPANQSANQLTEEPTNQPAKQPANLPSNQGTRWPVDAIGLPPLCSLPQLSLRAHHHAAFTCSRASATRGLAG